MTSPFSTSTGPGAADPFAAEPDLGDTVDIGDAARQLGISEAAVKLAIERGFLRGYYQEVSGRWRVRLEYTGAGAERAERGGTARAVPQQRSRPEPAVAPPATPVSEPQAPRAPGPEVAPPAQGPFYPHAAGLPHAPPRPYAAPTPSVVMPVSPQVPVPAEPGAELIRAVEGMLREQISYLREQLERREAALRDKDAAVAELVLQLTKFVKRALPPPPETDGLKAEFERYRQDQQDVLERHEEAIASIGDTLRLVRDHLILLKPRDGNPPRR